MERAEARTCNKCFTEILRKLKKGMRRLFEDAEKRRAEKERKD